MALILYNSDLESPGTLIDPPDGADGLIAEGTSIVSIAAIGGDHAVLVDDNFQTMTVAGTVAGDHTAILLHEADGPGTLLARLSVAPTGMVAGRVTGIAAQDNSSDLSNLGTVSGRTGILVQGDSNAVFNGGTVAASGTGLAVGAGSFTRIDNTGTVSGNSEGVTVAGSEHSILNSGTISGALRGVGLGAAESVLVNSGTIQGTEGVAVFAPLVRVVNTGEILGGRGAAVSAQSDDNARTALINHGQIAGSVLFASAEPDAVPSDDRVVSSGAILGDVRLGPGNDLYRGIGDGFVSGTVYGEAGDDSLTGAANADTFRGGSEDDTLRGRAGEDDLEGGEGDDDMAGGAGDDRLDGQGGDDLLLGGRDDDAVIGGIGLDTLRGGQGDDLLDGKGDADVLIGGPGDDRMTGGGGPDVFVLRPGSGVDEIADFLSGADRVDVRHLGLAGIGQFKARYDFADTALGLHIDFGDGDAVFIAGLTEAGVRNLDFLF